MKGMRLRNLSLICCLLANFSIYGQSDQNLFIEFNKIVIHGQSNIEKFTLFYTNDSDTSTSEIPISRKDNYYTFNIPANNIKSEKSYIESDFRKLIKAKDYPFIQLGIDSTQIKLLREGHCNHIIVSIKITDVENSYPINLKQEQKNDFKYCINGKVELSLNDFNLEPCSRFFGLIRVDDKVVIDFRLFLSKKTT
jgi:hypothetical protein